MRTRNCSSYPRFVPRGERRDRKKSKRCRGCTQRRGEGRRKRGESEEEGFERGRLERSEAERRRRRRKGRGEETKTIDTVGTGKQGQSARALFAEWPIKMPTTSPAGPLIRRHVNQS